MSVVFARTVSVIMLQLLNRPRRHIAENFTEKNNNARLQSGGLETYMR